jgi:hypothetical protein
MSLECKVTERIASWLVYEEEMRQYVPHGNFFPSTGGFHVIIGFSLEEPMVEREFLRRELAVKWRTVDLPTLNREIAQRWSQGNQTLLLISNPEKYSELVQDAPSESLVLFLLSDEAYSPLRRRLASSESVATVFRHYDLHYVGIFRGLKKALESLNLVINETWTLKEYLKLIVQGIRSQTRMKSWRKIPVPVFICPLGYTEKFALAFCEIRREVKEWQSLFDILIDNTIPRSIEYCFRGSRGQLQRQQMISSIQALQKANDVVLVDGEWSGISSSSLSGTEYVQSLLRSINAICPPGYTNNESFRYYESLICGANPIELPIALSHMGYLPARPKNSEEETIDYRIDLVRNELEKIRQLLEATFKPSGVR